MSRKLSFYRLGRVAMDAFFGLAAFVLLDFVFSEGAGISMAANFASPLAVQMTPFVILAVVFSSLVAFNLAILRHLRRVYASPRRGVWRRG